MSVVIQAAYSVIWEQEIGDAVTVVSKKQRWEHSICPALSMCKLGQEHGAQEKHAFNL